jgi:hypothetical protein
MHRFANSCPGGQDSRCTFVLILVPAFLRFESLRVHTGYMLTLVEYLLWVPDSIAPAQPDCLRAIQAEPHTLNQITLKHWQVHSLLLGSTLVSA